MIDRPQTLESELGKFFGRSSRMRSRIFFHAIMAGALIFTGQARARQSAASDSLPDQAHAMTDVGYHFANLWFAGQNKNWDLARYELETTRSHLKSAVKIRPVYATKSGAQVDLNAILDAVNNTMLKAAGEAIDSRDAAGFEAAYRQTMSGCYACHASCEKPFLRVQIPQLPGSTIIDFAPPEASAETGQDDAGLGKAFFQQNCALCHAAKLGPGNMAIGGQGPSLVGVIGRSAASAPNFSYSKALASSGLVWNSATLDRFLANPISTVPGTTMLVLVPDEMNRRHLIAYLTTLVAPAASADNAAAPVVAPVPATDPGDWRHAAPGAQHRIDLAALPAPFSTPAAGNPPHVVPRPADAQLSVPPNFSVRVFAGGLSGPRLLRVAPNGDIFIAETGESRIRVMRAADGAEEPSVNQIFADDLDRPFGIAFYPPTAEPLWIYFANNNSVVRFPYRNGDLKARGPAEVVLPQLARSTGGHTTRDVAFTKDGKRMFVSVGSGSNVAEEMKKKSAEAIREWEAARGLGAAWDSESNRANILVTDPEGREPLRPFATGVRNGAGMAVNQETGDLWVSTNERDGLGDDLVPDYITRIKEGGYYGWPWYYMGNHEDPRHAGERPDLAGKATVPDVPLQSHSATLEMTFYTVTSGVSAFPEDYRGDIFAAFHGSWNRNNRTGYKVVRVRCHDGLPTGEYDDFLTGFVVDNQNVWGRPVGVAAARDGALLVTDDASGTVWRVSYQK
jgi:glucose/arabinose dehydrogenase/cytochrome c1